MSKTAHIYVLVNLYFIYSRITGPKGQQSGTLMRMSLFQILCNPSQNTFLNNNKKQKKYWGIRIFLLLEIHSEGTNSLNLMACYLFQTTQTIRAYVEPFFKFPTKKFHFSNFATKCNTVPYWDTSPKKNYYPLKKLNCIIAYSSSITYQFSIITSYDSFNVMG